MITAAAECCARFFREEVTGQREQAFSKGKSVSVGVSDMLPSDVLALSPEPGNAMRVLSQGSVRRPGGPGLIT